MGRYFEGLYPDFLMNPPEIPAAIQIGSIGNLIFDGKGVSNYALTVSNLPMLKLFTRPTITLKRIVSILKMVLEGNCL